MNGVDILFIFLLIGGLALGFFQGTVRLAVAVASLYVSILIASLYFQALGSFFRTRFGSDIQTAQIVAFFILLLVLFLLLTTFGVYTFRYVQIPHTLEYIDRSIGLMLGLVLSGLFLGMMAVILRDLFVFRDVASVSNNPLVIWFQRSVRSSQMIQFFGSYILPYIFSMVRPFLPAEAELIFRLQ